MHGTCLCPSVDLTFVCHSEETRRLRDDEESPGSEGLGEILVLPVPGVVSWSLPALSLSKGRRAQNDTQSFPDGN